MILQKYYWNTSISKLLDLVSLYINTIFFLCWKYLQWNFISNLVQKLRQLKFVVYCFKLYDKDHQRMMEDPIFMIVQRLRSFLTAATPTTVTPTAVTSIVVIYLNLPEFTSFFFRISLIYLNLPWLNGSYLNLPVFISNYLKLPNIPVVTWSYLRLP